MVESFVKSLQPQEQVEDVMQGYHDLQVKQIESEYQQATAQILRGIQKLENFKKKINRELKDLCQRAEKLEQKLRNFETANDNRINNLHVFSFNNKFYDGPLKIKADAIFAGIDQNIKGWNSQIEELQAQKEKRISKLAEAFKAYRQIQNDGPAIQRELKLIFKKLNFEKSIETQRYLGFSGPDTDIITKKTLFDSGQKIGPFRWAYYLGAKELWSENQINLVSLELTMSTGQFKDRQAIAGLQLVFSKGLRSQYFEFLCLQGNESKKTLEIDEFRQVKKIKSTWHEGFLVSIDLEYKQQEGQGWNSTLFSWLSGESEFELDDGEQIIGLYGSKKSLGFIVWIPVYE